ncbi:hypothetical protein PG614_09890 [Riemerella anatipestifer]|nr:hypothetical protein [Riemerella anatipestifer]MDY3534179.1 hypothetical protein [Riemerella anatipestifer]MDY3536256.1 hypothetical protein [Riemerella anatipestifer]
MLVLLFQDKSTKSSRAKVRFAYGTGLPPCYLEAIAPNTATGAVPKLTFARQSVDNN